ncbi:unnamed protein product [Mytilus coruscus]|uniref:HSPA12A n=1 Tax=Mytilus coruscus TaxID=42192 RepID=A0A6J8CRV6_MYTCO|nr:unnamed protein product [Mytilus coruscus]
MTDLGKSIFVVGIDIGSEYSGYAISSVFDIKCDPPKFDVAFCHTAKLITSKCQTAILLNGNEEMVAFGYQAESRFTELLEFGEHHDYYYFKNFRNDLHQREAGNPMIKDVSGKPLEALKVISQTIGYFKYHAIIGIKERLSPQHTLVDEDLYFVLTVPTTWDDKEKDFMRKATIMAGIKENKLRIAFEPEAASLYILRTDSSQSHVGKRIKKGEKYMVIDVGGLHNKTS